MEDLKLKIIQAKESDFLSIYDFVSKCKPLEVYPEHLYKIILRYFNDTCFILKFQDKLIGFAIGFISQVHLKRFFLWQLGIDSKFQNRGVGGHFLKRLENKIKQKDIKQIELTVDPVNIASMKLFKKMGYKNVSKKEGKCFKVSNIEAVKDYYKTGRHFVVFQKKID